MKANQLRIGNLVYCKGIIDIIGGVEDNNYYTEKHYHGNTNEDLKPIPLTEEWLFKCAFIKLDDLDEVYYTLGNNEFHIKIEDKVFWIYFDEQPNHPITCVFNLHQLQNLYFALTENELNITL